MVRSAILCVVVTYGAIVGVVPLWPAGHAEDENAAARRELIADLSPGGEDDAAYTVAIAAVVAPGATPQERTVLGSYVQIVRDLVAGVETRYVDDEERAALALDAIEAHRRDLSTRFDDRVRSLERRRLEGDERDADSAELRRDDSRLADIREELELLSNVRSVDVPVPAEWSVRLLDEPYRFRRTLPSLRGLEHLLPDAHLLIYLTIDPIGTAGERIVQVRSYHPATQVDRELFRVVAAGQAISAQLELYERELVTAVSGRPLGSVTVRARDAEGNDLPDADVYLGGRYLGTAPADDRYLLPGTYDVRVRLPDGREARRSVVVVEQERADVTVELVEAPPESIVVRSTPSGARVYRGSMWVGFTPVLVPRHREMMSYTISAEGYYDSRITVGPETPDVVERVLVSADEDWAAQVEDSRDRFYRSFGFFALSLGVPIIVNGVYQNYQGLADPQTGRLNSDLTAAEQERIIRQTDALLVGYYGGVGLSVTLFGHMIWRLVDYVQTAQGYHTR